MMNRKKLLLIVSLIEMMLLLPLVMSFLNHVISINVFIVLLAIITAATGAAFVIIIKKTA